MILITRNPYPFHYRMAFAFSRLLYPTPHRLALRFAVPTGRMPGLPRFLYVPSDGLGAVCSPVVVVSAIGKRGNTYTDHMPFGSSLSAPLACSFSRRLSTVHITFSIPSTLAPTRIDARRRVVALRFRRSPFGDGYIVPSTSHRCVTTTAWLGRVPVAEHQVMSYNL